LSAASPSSGAGGYIYISSALKRQAHVSECITYKVVYGPIFNSVHHFTWGAYPVLLTWAKYRLPAHHMGGKTRTASWKAVASLDDDLRKSSAWMYSPLVQHVRTRSDAPSPFCAQTSLSSSTLPRSAKQARGLDCVWVSLLHDPHCSRQHTNGQIQTCNLQKFDARTCNCNRRMYTQHVCGT
jgi:hypothetical protein